MIHEKDNPVLTFTLHSLETIRVLWWRVFDWIATVTWFSFVVVFFLALMFGAMLGFGPIVPPLMIIAFIIKVSAGGKRRAEILAKEASTRADHEALERRVVEAELATLQAQIEPHFLFNTLALIGADIESNPHNAAKVHAELVKYLRAAMPQMRATHNPSLGQQVELSCAYLNIMQARMQERLSFTVNLPTELEGVEFPALMLQTMVENAIKHGLEPKLAGGHILIEASMAAQTLSVAVSDTGLGLNPHAEDGVGLRNIRERLKALYGHKARLLTEIPEAGGARFLIQIDQLG